MSIATGLVGTLAGGGGTNGAFADGPGVLARFNSLRSVAAAPDGTIYVADCSNHVVRVIVCAATPTPVAVAVTPTPTPSPSAAPATTCVTTTIGGSPGVFFFVDGLGTAAAYNFPNGVAVLPNGTGLVVADTSNLRIRGISFGDGSTYRLAGSGTNTPFIDGSGAAATFRDPFAVATDSAGNVYVADTSEWGGGELRVCAANELRTVRTPPRAAPLTRAPPFLPCAQIITAFAKCIPRVKPSRSQALVPQVRPTVLPLPALLMVPRRSSSMLAQTCSSQTRATSGFAY